MNIRFVDAIYDSDCPGDAKYFTNHSGLRLGGLNIRCPGCGTLSVLPFRPVEEGPAWDWDGNKALPTLVPSIWHKGGCGWHGHLIAGKFVEG